MTTFVLTCFKGLVSVYIHAEGIAPLFKGSCSWGWSKGQLAHSSMSFGVGLVLEVDLLLGSQQDGRIVPHLQGF